MSITTVGDHLIHYEVLGRGEPMIFVHGWLGSWRYWWSSMQAVANHCRSFAFDLWGYGDSSKASETNQVNDRYSFESYVDMLDKFVDKLGIARPVTLVGHSLGAAVCLRYAIHRPEMVNRLVTVSLPVRGNLINSRLFNSDLDTIVNKVLGRHNSFPEVDSELRKTDKRAINLVSSQMAQYNFGADLERCPCPVLMVFGDQDAIIQPPLGEAYLQRSGNNRAYVSLESCNHFPMLQHAAKFNRLLLDFMHSNNSFADLTPKDYWQRRTH